MTNEIFSVNDDFDHCSHIGLRMSRGRKKNNHWASILVFLTPYHTPIFLTDSYNLVYSDVDLLVNVCIHKGAGLRRYKWVGHDPTEIWESQRTVAKQVLGC